MSIISMEDQVVKFQYRDLKAGGDFTGLFTVDTWSDDTDVNMYNDSPPLASDRVGATGDRVTFRNADYGGEVTFKFLPMSYWGIWFMQKEVEERGKLGGTGQADKRYEWNMESENLTTKVRTIGTSGYLLTVPRGLTIGKENASNIEITISFRTLNTVLPEDVSNLVGVPEPIPPTPG